MKKIAIIICLFAVLAPPPVAQASVYNPDFDPNFVVSNAETQDIASMDADDIQSFLLAKGSGLASRVWVGEDGKAKRAGDVIMEAALANLVSPRFLLTLLQREQSLVTDPFPSSDQIDWATGYGVCDSCSKNNPALAKYRGFINQVNSAAASIRFYLDGGNASSGLRESGVPTVIDGVPVTPSTDATAALYNYTPHIMAQLNFWKIWQKYFVRRYPNGSILKAAGSASYWYILNGERRRLSSPAVLLSRFSAGKVVEVSANDILSYPAGPEMKFANYSLLRSPKGTVYLIVDDERRGFVSRDVFRKLGFSASEVDDVTFEDLAAYREGEPITMAAAYPLGALLQSTETGGVYYVQNGVKRPLYGRELLSLYFGKLKIKADGINELKSFTDGTPIALRDGELVRSATKSTVYVISDGERHSITSADQFEEQGWKWENVVTVSDKVLALSPLGVPFASMAEDAPSGTVIASEE